MSSKGLRSIEEEWANYLATVYKGQDLHPSQLNQLRAAFFGGCIAMFFQCRRIGESGVSEGEALVHLAKVEQEIFAYGEKCRQLAAEFRAQELARDRDASAQN